MITYTCDKCGKELDGRNMDYVGIMIDDYADNEGGTEHWQLCHDCYTSVKRALIKAIAGKTGTD